MLKSYMTKKHPQSANLHRTAFFNFVKSHILFQSFCRIAKFGEDILNHDRALWKMFNTAVLTLNFDL